MAVDIINHAQALNPMLAAKTRTKRRAVESVATSDMPMMSGGRMQTSRALMLKLGMANPVHRARMEQRAMMKKPV